VAAGLLAPATRPLFATGLFERDPDVDLPFEVDQILYVDHAYPRTSSAWSGPVAVLVDDGSASASELFAASLKFSAGAVLLGRHTASAGSGWSLGRASWPLTRSGMNLYLPDTVEYWPDGANAREGLEPDIRIPSRPREHPDLTARWLRKTLTTLSFRQTDETDRYVRSISHWPRLAARNTGLSFGSARRAI